MANDEDWVFDVRRWVAEGGAAGHGRSTSVGIEKTQQTAADSAPSGVIPPGGRQASVEHPLNLVRVSAAGVGVASVNGLLPNRKADTAFSRRRIGKQGGISSSVVSERYGSSRR